MSDTKTNKLATASASVYCVIPNVEAEGDAAGFVCKCGLVGEDLGETYSVGAVVRDLDPDLAVTVDVGFFFGDLRLRRVKGLGDLDADGFGFVGDFIVGFVTLEEVWVRPVVDLEIGEDNRKFVCSLSSLSSSLALSISSMDLLLQPFWYFTNALDILDFKVNDICLIAGAELSSCPL
ncbi:hypothetical protein WICPIJ_002792 [Wickerhamomyces pijperi]|uniref:Uncharacterized protein n=1 Tax=Wickerhamomyces pijperi TaxID=599730 RepID=A0A9P8QAT6_WICPI|nr:hypothetical protein WICPIJ_002792 [Wickerhamomyces pijperi]